MIATHFKFPPVFTWRDKIANLRAVKVTRDFLDTMQECQLLNCDVREYLCRKLTGNPYSTEGNYERERCN
jgi:hypothetical protein